MKILVLSKKCSRIQNSLKFPDLTAFDKGMENNVNLIEIEKDWETWSGTGSLEEILVKD